MDKINKQLRKKLNLGGMKQVGRSFWFRCCGERMVQFEGSANSLIVGFVTIDVCHKCGKVRCIEYSWFGDHFTIFHIAV